MISVKIIDEDSCGACAGTYNPLHEALQVGGFVCVCTCVWSTNRPAEIPDDDPGACLS